MARSKAFLAALTVGLALCGQAHSQPIGPSYVLTLSSLASVHVDLDLPSAPATLYMMTAASGAEDGFAPFIKNLSMQCSGRSLSLTRQGAVWKMGGTSTAPCRIRYDVDLSIATRHWDVGNEQAAFTDGQGMFAVSKALFVESDLPGERRLQIRKPAAWQLQTPWAADAHGIFPAATRSIRKPISKRWACTLMANPTRTSFISIPIRRHRRTSWPSGAIGRISDCGVTGSAVPSSSDPAGPDVQCGCGFWVE